MKKNLITFQVTNKCKDIKNNINTINNTITQLSQEEIADGWQQILPKKYKGEYINPIYITLSELPPHLFHKSIIKIYLYLNNLDIENTTDAIYFTIFDHLFTYNVLKSANYELIYDLYIEINKTNRNRNKIQSLYDECKLHNTIGWLMIVAKKYLNNE